MFTIKLEVGVKWRTAQFEGVNLGQKVDEKNYVAVMVTNPNNMTRHISYFKRVLSRLQ